MTTLLSKSWKRATISVIITYDVSIPEDREIDDVDFHRNESSRCAGSIIQELEQLEEKNGCLCGFTEISCEKVFYLKE